MTASRLVATRIRINAQGYDDTGAYWGAGADAFIVATDDGDEEITVRARSAKEARDKAKAELDRPEDERSPSRAKLGGNARRKTCHRIEWRHPSTGAVVSIRITHSRDYLIEGTDHIELESIAPKRSALPITETGYLSHFIDWRQLKDAGGPKQFVESWLARQCRSKDWQKKDAARAQGDLFQWAETRAEATKRGSVSKVRRAAPSDRPTVRRKQKKPSRDHG